MAEAVLDYSHRDILAARTSHNEISNVLKAHERGERSDAMLQDIKILCSYIIQTIRDSHCQQKMREVELHSDKLFAVDKRLQRSRSTQSDSMFLRQLIFKSLVAFDDRLRSLDTTRQSARDASGTSAATSL